MKIGMYLQPIFSIEGMRVAIRNDTDHVRQYWPFRVVYLPVGTEDIRGHLPVYEWDKVDEGPEYGKVALATPKDRYFIIDVVGDVWAAGSKEECEDFMAQWLMTHGTKAEGL